MDLVDYNTVVLVPNSDNVIRSYYYNINNKGMIEGPVIPTEMRGKELVSHGLLNGDVAYFKTTEQCDEYMYYVRKENMFYYKTTDITLDKPFNNTIKLRDGRLIKFGQKSDNVVFNYLYE
jgi:hypothetical protein